MRPYRHVLCLRSILTLAWIACSAAALVVEEWNLPALPAVFPTPVLPASEITKAFNTGASGTSAAADAGTGGAIKKHIPRIIWMAVRSEQDKGSDQIYHLSSFVGHNV